MMTCVLAGLVTAGAVTVAHSGPPPGDFRTQVTAVLESFDESWLRRPLTITLEPCNSRRRFDTRGEHRVVCYGTGVSGLEQALAAAIIFADARSEVASRRRRWRDLNGWRWLPGGGWRAANEDVAGYGEIRGMRSPHHDFAFLAARLWAQPEDPVGCRLISQRRFVNEILGLHDSVACPEFEAWARLDELVDIELVLAAPTDASPASLFGHVLLRLDYHAGRSPLLDSRAISYVANTVGPVEDDPAYPIKGISGFYDAELVEQDFLEVYRQYAQIEQRELERWRLRLSPVEQRAWLERIWSGLHAGRYRYYFLRRNCASMLVDLINGVREEPIRFPGGVAAGPPAVIEGFAHARNAAGEPLLESRHELTSMEQEALQASVELRGALAKLPRRLAASLRSPDAAVRAAAYRRLASNPSAEQVLSAAVVLEAYATIVANRRAQIERNERRLAMAQQEADHLAQALTDREAALARPVSLLSAQARSRRLTGYQQLADILRLEPQLPTATRRDVRRLVLLTSEYRGDVVAMRKLSELRHALLFPAPGTIFDQPYVRGYEELIRVAHAMEVSPALFAAVEARRRQARPSRGSPAGEPVWTKSGYERAIPSSGVSQTAVGTEVDARGRPTLSWSAALLDHRLGERRRFGLPPTRAMTLLESRLSVDPGAMRIVGARSRLLGYRSLHQRPGPHRAPWWGLDLFVDTRTDHRARLDGSVTGGTGIAVVIWQRNTLEAHLLATGGVRGGIAWRPRPTDYVGTYATLEGRLPLAPQGRSVHALCAWARTEPGWSWAERAWQLGWEVGSEARIGLHPRWTATIGARVGRNVGNDETRLTVSAGMEFD